MKIAFVVQNYYPSFGGSQFVIQKVAERLVAEYGDEVTVLTTDALESPHRPNTNPVFPKYEVINGVVVKRFPFIRFHVKFFKLLIRFGKKTNLYGTHLLTILRNGPLSVSMYREMRALDVDVIIGTSSHYAHMLFPIAGRQSQPFVYFGAIHFENQKTEVPTVILKAIGKSSAYIANTDYEKSVLVTKGVEEDKLFSLGCGVDISLFERTDDSEIRDRYGIHEAPLVGYIGRQASFKGIDTLLYAMPAVWNKIPDAFLLIAGTETGYSLKIREMIKALPEDQQKKVIYINSFDEQEKAKLYNALDVFVSVSSSESFGISYVEAWACKKPVIGCDIEQVKSVISENIDGYIVSKKDYSDLTNKIIMLINNKSIAEEMGLHGYNKVREKYSWSKITDSYRQICLDAIGKKHRVKCV